MQFLHEIFKQSFKVYLFPPLRISFKCIFKKDRKTKVPNIPSFLPSTFLMSIQCTPRVWIKRTNQRVKGIPTNSSSKFRIPPSEYLTCLFTLISTFSAIGFLSKKHMLFHIMIPAFSLAKPPSQRPAVLNLKQLKKKQKTYFLMFLVLLHRIYRDVFTYVLDWRARLCVPKWQKYVKFVWIFPYHILVYVFIFGNSLFLFNLR